MRFDPDKKLPQEQQDQYSKDNAHGTSRKKKQEKDKKTGKVGQKSLSPDEILAQEVHKKLNLKEKRVFSQDSELKKSNILPIMEESSTNTKSRIRSELQDPFHTQVVSFLDHPNRLKLAQALSGEDAKKVSKTIPQAEFQKLVALELVQGKTAAQIKEIFKEQLEQITEIYLTDLKKICKNDENVLATVIQLFPCVQSLNISGQVVSEKFIQTHLKDIINNAQVLTKVDLKRCTINDEILKEINEKKTLKTIELYQCKAESCSFSSPMFKHLDKLTLKSTTLTDSCLKLLSSENLKEIELTEIDKVKGDFLSEKPFKSIERLELIYCNDFDTTTLSKISSSSIHSLKIASCSKATAAFLKSDKFKELKNLSLEDMSLLTDDDLEGISSSSLEKININHKGNNCSGRFLQSTQFSNLKSLVLTYFPKLTDDIVQKLSSDKLTKVQIRYGSITGACFSDEKFKNIEILDLYYCDNVTDDDLGKISSKNVKELDISQTQCIGRCLSEKQFQHLEKLSAGSLITDTILEKILSKDLHTLHVAGSLVDGSFLKDTGRFSKLKELSLRNCAKLQPINLQYLPKTLTKLQSNPEDVKQYFPKELKDKAKPRLGEYTFS